MTALARIPGLSRRSTRSRIGRSIFDTALVLAGVIMLSPVAWVLANSLEQEKVQFALPPQWFPHPFTLFSYQQLFQEIPFLEQLANSLIIAVAVVVGSTIVSVLAAYAFARMEFPGKNVLFVILLSGLMLPTQIAAVPEFEEVKYLGLLNTRFSLIIPALIQVFGIFLLRNHFKTIPRELEDAARIDGAGELQILRRVIVPLSWPALSAVAIITTQYIWNDFFWPNLFITSAPKQMPAALGLVTLQNSFLGGPVAGVFAGLSVLSIPVIVLFILLQRQLMEGFGYAGISR
jgi:multiple sugar transport system permease protein